MSEPPDIGGHPWRDWPPEHRTLQELLRHAERHQADDPVLTVGDRAYTGAELARTAARSAAFLRRHGVSAGDRVVVVTPNRAELVEVMLGCVWAGVVFVPLNPTLRGELLRHQLRTVTPTLVVYDRVTASALHAVTDVFASAPPALVYVSTPPLDPYPDDLPAAPADLVAASHGYDLGTAQVAPHPVEPRTTAAVLFTSGTTGPSKGVTMPHGQFFWWSVVCAEELRLRDDDVLYTCLPLFHTNALTTLWQALAAQGRAVVGPKFSVSAFWDRLDDAGATVTFLLGAMSTMLWNRRPPEGRSVPTLRLILGPGIDAALKPDFERHFDVQVVEGFGMTEIGVAFYTPVERRTTGVLGVCHPDYEVAVLDEHDRPVPPGQPGELVVRPRQPHLISTGYFANPEATLASRRNLWFHTGDLVSVDPDGMYRYRDRIKDSIRRRGENISSHEVESVFAAHPRVAAAAAVAVPSELGEDEVLVCLQPTDGDPVDPAELVAFAAPELPDHALPRYVRLMPALPLTANSKVAKHVLRATGVTDDTWERR